MRGPAVLRKLEFGDLLLFCYIAVFARQCFWILDSNALAWLLAIALSALLWFAHIRTKAVPEERTPRTFWLVVGLPLFFVYAMRLAFPDMSFDVLNHRLIQSERALRGVLLMPGDFFPTIFPFNPSSDMLTGLTRTLLGYRLGTIVNFFALLWAGTVLNKILRPFIQGATWRCLGILLVLFAENLLFEINTYMVDLLALPLMLEATLVALRYDQSANKSRELIFSALLLGTSAALKLTNIAMIVPVLLIFAFKVFNTWREAKTVRVVLLSAVAFLIPMLPHAVYIYRETGSPFFPLYNRFFRSPFWPDINVYDGRWGPKGFWETITWPLSTITVPERLSELGVYSGRITFGVVAAMLCLFIPRVDRRIRLLSFAMLLGSLLWSATSGYVRYATFVEVLGGVLVLYLSRYIFERAGGWLRPLKLAAAALPLCLLTTQCVFAANYVAQTEWSKRPTVFDDYDAFRKELRWVWRDRELMSFQTQANRALFGPVEAWIVSGVKSNGVQVLLRHDVPMLAVNNLEYFDQPQSRERFARELEALRGKRVFSLTLTEELDASLAFIKRRKLTVGKITTCIVPFFSAHRQIHMTLIEIGLPEKREWPQRSAQAPEVTEATGPLNDNAFNASLSATGAPVTLRPGEKATILVAVKNLSDYVWPARGQKDGKYSINVADSWFDAGDDRLVNNLDGRTTLPRNLWPGESVEVPLTINAPGEAGEYFLEIDLVQEGVTFFKARGSQHPRYRIKVE